MKQFVASLSTIPPMALTLGLAGLLPFLAGGLGVWLPFLGDWRFGLPVLVSGYAALIAAFLGGVRWGAAMQSPNAGFLSRYLLLAILPSLLALATLVLPQRHALLLLLSMFIAQGVVDMLAVRRGHLVNWYAPLRLILTSGVSLCLLSMLLHNFLR